MTDPARKNTSYIYAKQNFWQSFTDPNNHTSRREFDSSGNVTKLTDAGG